MASRLPIYRSLSKRLEILGLGLWEIAILVSAFVIVNELFSFIKYRTLLSFAIVLSVALVFRHLNRKFDPHFLSRLIRFISFPDTLHKIMFSKKREFK